MMLRPAARTAPQRKPEVVYPAASDAGAQIAFNASAVGVVEISGQDTERVGGRSRRASARVFANSGPNHFRGVRSSTDQGEGRRSAEIDATGCRSTSIVDFEGSLRGHSAPFDSSAPCNYRKPCDTTFGLVDDPYRVATASKVVAAHI